MLCENAPAGVEGPSASPTPPHFLFRDNYKGASCDRNVCGLVLILLDSVSNVNYVLSAPPNQKLMSCVRWCDVLRCILQTLKERQAMELKQLESIVHGALEMALDYMVR